MTVDRVQVLATPGMDRHGAYVAMSRHRESVDLHYGRDDFRNQSKLVRTLGRERGKDMASDYRVRAPEPAKKAEPKRGTFEDRKSVVEGKSVSGRVDLGGRRILNNKKKYKITRHR